MDNISEINKKIKRLEEKMAESYRRGVMDIKTQAKLNELKKTKAFMEENEKALLQEILRGQPQEIADRFDTLSLLVVTLADLVDGLIMDENAILDKITDGRGEMHITTIGREIKKLAHRFVSMNDSYSNMATAENYGQFSDTIKPWLTKKAEEHLAWAKMTNPDIKYATE